MTDYEQTLVFAGVDLLQWKPAYNHAVTRLEGDALVFADTRDHDWHLLRLESPDFFLKRVRLRLVVLPFPFQDSNIYLHHHGKLDVGEITSEGVIVNRGISLSLTTTRMDNGLIGIEAVFFNRHASLAISTSRGGPVHAGSGRDQFAILGIEVSLADPGELLHGVPDAERLRIVDVGGAGGLQEKWLPHVDKITPILFEPNPAEAKGLREMIGRIPGGLVVESGLAAVTGPQKLNVAAYWGCTSLRQPNFEVLDCYSIGGIFKTVKVEDVYCTRYDLLHQRGQVPAPDAIKIDVQGYEYEVLLGFGALLETCLGIELEAHFYPLYHGQKLLHDLVRLLDEFGLVLRAVRPVPNFDGDLVEVDAFFTRRREKCQVLGPVEQRKLALLTQVWGISPYPE